MPSLLYNPNSKLLMNSIKLLIHSSTHSLVFLFTLLNDLSGFTHKSLQWSSISMYCSSKDYDTKCYSCTVLLLRLW